MPPPTCRTAPRPTATQEAPVASTAPVHAAASALRRRSVLGGAALLAAPGLLRAQQGVGPSEIVVGQTISLQGGRNPYAAEAQAGITACLSAVNQAGGVNGRRIRLVTLDDDGKADQAEANARRLVADGAFVLFGSLEGGPSTAVMGQAVALDVPLFGPMAGSPGLRRPAQRLVFPVRAEHREEFRALIEQGQRIGLRRVALFHADTGVGREHLTNVADAAAEFRIEAGGGLPFKGDIDDAGLDRLVATIAERKVDLVINHGSAGLYERLIRRARAAGSRTTFWGVNSGSTPLARALGPLAHGMVFAQIVPNPQSGKTALVREYQQQMQAAAGPTPPAFGYGSLEGFMTAKALVAALRAAGTAPTRTTLLAALDRFDLDLGGVQVRYRPGERTGATFVDLALVARDGRFVQ